MDKLAGSVYDCSMNTNETRISWDGCKLEVQSTAWAVAEALLDDSQSDLRSSYRDPGESSWFGAILAETKKLVVEGWSQQAALIRGRDPKWAIREVPGFDYSLAEDGSEPDVAAYLAGEEACMGDMRIFPQPKPVVRIGVQIAVSCGHNTSEMLARGRSIFTCIEHLRTAGYPVELDALITLTSERGSEADIAIQVQAADQPLHPGMIAFWVAHPAALRRAGFALMETFPQTAIDDFGFKRGGPYGFPAYQDTESQKNRYDEIAPADPKQAQAWVASVLERRLQ